MAKRVARLMLAGVAALALAGCGGGDGVATLGNKGKGKEQTQADGARAMVKCLQDGGVETELNDDGWGEGQASFSLTTDKAYAIGYGDGSAEFYAGDGVETEAEFEAAEKRLNELISKYDPSVNQPEGEGAAFNFSGGSRGGVAVEAGEAEPAASEPAAAPPTTDAQADEDAGEGLEAKEDEESPEEDIPDAAPYLIIGDDDRTELFVTCLEESGYTQPEYHTDPAEEIKDKQASLEATNKWIACAREHGFPDTADPAPAKADEYQTRPMALLPGDITEPELRALLKECPNFDVEDHKAADLEVIEAVKKDPKMSDSASTKLYEELTKKHPGMIDPQIGFDAPGFDGKMVTGEFSEDSEAEFDRLSKLQEILYEAMNAYYEEMAPKFEEIAGR